MRLRFAAMLSKHAAGHAVTDGMRYHSGVDEKGASAWFSSQQFCSPKAIAGRAFGQMYPD
jgi:hypothetical protein